MRPTTSESSLAWRPAASPPEPVPCSTLSDHVTVTQTGCIGICQYEPIVEVYEKDKEKVTYVKMDAAKAKEVIERHLKGGNPVTEYTIGKVLS